MLCAFRFKKFQGAVGRVAYSQGNPLNAGSLNRGMYTAFEGFIQKSDPR